MIRKKMSHGGYERESFPLRLLVVKWDLTIPRTKSNPEKKIK